MGGIFGKGSSAKQSTAAGSLQLQGAQRGGVIPLVYGTTRVAVNVLDYDDFHTIQAAASSVHKGKGGIVGGVTGKSGKGQQQVTEYVASFILGVCVGPIFKFGQVWYDKFLTTLGGGGPLSPNSINLGLDGQNPDSFWSVAHPTKALGYSGTANVAFANYNLGVTSTLPNFSVEVFGLQSHTGVNGMDASPDQVIVDYLTNARYGAGFPIANLDLDSFNSSIPSSYASYVRALGLWMSVSLETQQEAQQELDAIAKLTNSEVVWSGGLLKLIPRGDQQVIGAITSNASWTITLAGGDASGAETITVTISDPVLGTESVTTSPTTFAGEHLQDIGNNLVSALNTIVGTFGIVITNVTSATVPPVGPPPLSQNNSAIVTISMIQNPPTGATSVAVFGPPRDFSVTVSTSESGGVGTYTPNNVPIYSLTDDDFIPPGSASNAGMFLGAQPGGAALRSGATPVTGSFSDDPLHIQRTSPADANNVIRLECLDRGALYNSTVVEVSDQASIDAYGLRVESSINARGIVDPGNVGYTVAQLLLQRSLLYRNTYTFQLGWNYVLLEPMDLVQISDPRLGANALTVRVTAVEEDEEGTLMVTAEDYFGAYSSTVLYPRSTFSPASNSTILGVGGGVAPPQRSVQLNLGSAENQAQQPFATNPPIIFFPPQSLVTSPTGYELWIALSGVGNWGGAQVWLSVDGVSYASIGQVAGASAMGVLTATLASYGGANPDVGDVLSVDLTESNGTLTSVSATNAASGVSLCYVDGEFLSYENATLTAAFKYNLTTLYRGLSGSTAAGHASGSAFTMIGPATGRFPIPASMIGTTVSIKFLAFNGASGGTQNLADVSPISVTLNPTNQNHANTFVTGSVVGLPTSGATVQIFTFGVETTFPIGLVGSVGSAGTAATGTATFNVQKNGSNIGTMVFAPSATTATFALASATMFAPGDVLEMVAPSPQDGTLANVSWTLAGSTNA